MHAKANESKVQIRADGTAYTQIPAFARDSAELKKGTLLRWTPNGRGWALEVVGFEEPKRRAEK